MALQNFDSTKAPDKKQRDGRSTLSTDRLRESHIALVDLVGDEATSALQTEVFPSDMDKLLMRRMEAVSPKLPDHGHTISRGNKMMRREAHQSSSPLLPQSSKLSQNSKLLQASAIPRSSSQLTSFKFWRQEVQGGPIVGRQQREEALRDAVGAFTAAGVSFAVSYGSLIGLVREGRLLDKDDDVDILVEDEDFALLQPTIAKIRGDIHVELHHPSFHRASAPLWGPVDLYRVRAVDLSHVQDGAEKELLCEDQDKLLLNRSGIFPPKIVQFTGFPGLKVPVPNDAEGFLESRYGKDWHQPQHRHAGSFSTPQSVQQYHRLCGNIPSSILETSIPADLSRLAGRLAVQNVNLVKNASVGPIETAPPALLQLHPSLKAELAVSRGEIGLSVLFMVPLVCCLGLAYNTFRRMSNSDDN